MHEERQRSHAWPDPTAQAEHTRTLSGQEFYESWLAGELTPPIAATLDFQLTDFREGFIEVTCTPQEYHYSPYGMAHGGLAATLLDTATGCAIHTRLPAGTGYATLELKVNYFRPITVDTGPVRAVGDVLSFGKRVAVSEGKIFDGSDRQLAHAIATCLIM